MAFLPQRREHRTRPTRKRLFGPRSVSSRRVSLQFCSPGTLEYRISAAQKKEHHFLMVKKLFKRQHCGKSWQPTKQLHKIVTKRYLCLSFLLLLSGGGKLCNHFRLCRWKIRSTHQQRFSHQKTTPAIQTRA